MSFYMLQFDYKHYGVTYNCLGFDLKLFNSKFIMKRKNCLELEF